MGNSLNLYEVASRMNPGREIASVAWIGYNAPSGRTMATETVSQRPAEEGGALLARDIAAANAARDFHAERGGPARAENHILAHSYGSTTTGHAGDRKSTRLNSCHVKISYAVFCLKKKTEWA